MQLDYSIATIQHKDEVLRVLQFLSRQSILKEFAAEARLNDAFKSRTVIINIIGSRRMKTLNATYRKKESSTDVLSFELYENGILGELYICPDDISKNANMLKHSFEYELLEIIIHGLLHLAGYDHSDEMFSWQKIFTDRILNSYENFSRTR